jgi:hypothetical protein
MTRIFLHITLFFIFLTHFSFAQNFDISSQLDTNHILIGEQTHFSVTVAYPSNEAVTFPILSDTIIGEIEIVDLKIDTLSPNNTQQKFQFDYTITSFDSGYYVIPPQQLKMLSNGDSLETQALIFAVSTYQIDTTQAQIFDIKAPIEAPWTLAEFIEENYPYLIIGFIALTLIGLAVWFLRKRKLQVKEPAKIIVPKEAAHVIAFRSLSELKEKKLWQNDRVKLYYVELSDIVRTYIENRYRLLALESTTQELLDSISHNKYLNEEQLLMLKQVLYTADMAKFAKAKPLANENDLSFQNAYKLVDQTQISKSDIEEKKEVDDVQ